jgi:hypothetical protein
MVFGSRNPDLQTGTRSGWKMLRYHTRHGDAMNAWYIQSLWESGVPKSLPDRHEDKLERLVYRKLKGKPIPPRKGEGKRQTKKRR